MTTNTNATFVPSGPDRDTALEAVQHLLTRTVDARSGYDAMLDRAEPEFRPVVQKFRGTHEQHEGQLAAMITAMGGEPDTGGGMMSSVNKAVVSIRSLFDEIDDDVMDGIRDGEQRILDQFDEALQALGTHHPRDELVAMRRDITTLLEETRHLD